MDEHRPSLTTLSIAPDALTPHQCEVAGLIGEGLSNAEIARRLSLAPGTTANHVEAVLRRLNARGRIQVATWAIAHGLVTLLPPSASDEVADGAAEAAF